jgi:aldose 1-epimerase
MAVAANADTLVLRYRATTDRPTHLNLTNHPYFNLHRATAETIRGHDLQVFADQFTPTDPRFVPTGGTAEVVGSPLDLREPTMLAEILDHADLSGARGLNHNYVLSPNPSGVPRKAARLSEPQTGRHLEVWTTEPGLQVYSAGFLPALAGRAGERFGPEGGICLETQHFPDSPNRPEFPSTVLRPGETFQSTTVHRFRIA